MPKAPLHFEHLATISQTLDAFSRTGEDSVKVAVCLDLKDKIDKKIAGYINEKGYRLKLNRPEKELISQLNKLYIYHRDAKYSNSYFRLLQQNQ